MLQNRFCGKYELDYNRVVSLIICPCKLRPIVENNQKLLAAKDYADDDMAISKEDSEFKASADALSFIIDMREYDVPYTMRASIDLELRVGAWFEVTPQPGTEGW